MRVIYAPRAIADLAVIGIKSRSTFGDAAAKAVDTCIRATTTRISMFPDAAREIPERVGVRAVPVVKYPFKIFYTVQAETIIVLHIRHTAQSPNVHWAD